MNQTLEKSLHFRKLFWKYRPCHRSQTTLCDWIPQELSQRSTKKKIKEKRI